MEMAADVVWHRGFRRPRWETEPRRVRKEPVFMWSPLPSFRSRSFYCPSVLVSIEDKRKPRDIRPCCRVWRRIPRKKAILGNNLPARRLPSLDTQVE